jgi:hypothetical protein
MFQEPPWDATVTGRMICNASQLCFPVTCNGDGRLAACLLRISISLLILHARQVPYYTASKREHLTHSLSKPLRRATCRRVEGALVARFGIGQVIVWVIVACQWCMQPVALA